MKGSGQKRYEYGLEMLRRFASQFDVGAAKWLVSHDDVVGEVLGNHLNRLTPGERHDVYSVLFGFFRHHYKRVLDVRLQLEQDPSCREQLAALEKLHREEVNEPYKPTTDEELIASSEKNLL